MYASEVKVDEYSTTVDFAVKSKAESTMRSTTIPRVICNQNHECG